MSLRTVSQMQPRTCCLRIPLVPQTRTYTPITTSYTPNSLIPRQYNGQIQMRNQNRVFRTLPLSDLIRTLSVLSVAALPGPVLSTIIRFIRKHSRTIVSSPILSWPIRRTFYKAFCVGETKSEIAENIATLRSRGISGVVLSFAREAKLDEAEESTSSVRDDQQLRSWVASNIETIGQVSSSDYIAVKCTGAGAAVVKAMEEFSFTRSTESVQSPDVVANSSVLDGLKNGLFEICEVAQQRGVKVMIDAESSLHQPSIDFIALEAMATFNTQGSALVSNTYQMYLKSSLETLKSHLQIARSKGYVAGIKLVRGAYMLVEPDRAGIIHDTKTATDKAYDDAVDMLLGSSRTTNEKDSKPWRAEVMLATHNSRSVDAAMSLYRTQQSQSGGNQQVQKLVFAQLMGMADEISMKLASELRGVKPAFSSKIAEQTPSHLQDGGMSVCKYTVWGSLEECLLYMLRRAEENQDAAARSRVTAILMLKEIGNRLVFWR
ncbi:FAD-linked oxidoreductase [Byssothecium circinans]|uniref:Proline dehydrogenase n=1 Tax=Byssothecium circinans TaxID=147558 RepID=A0A6A5TH21_9PLEO|nr:FAD-linked oxidoreductase [Byssothecium circinans]